MPPRPGERKVGSPKSQTYDYQTAVFAFLLLLRIINALTVQTFFQPDEYFQSLEPAWQSTFGSQSGAWITWEWRQHLRSSIHPWIFATLYSLVNKAFGSNDAFNHTSAEALILAPKILQALFAATMDFFTWKLARRLYGHESSASLATLALTVLSPWQWFCSTRTLSNSLETTLTTVALAIWPWEWFLEQSVQAPQPNKSSQTQSQKSLETEQLTPDLKSFLEQAYEKHPEPPKRKVHSKGMTVVAPAGLERALFAAALACILRPTNIAIWATISITLLVRYGDSTKTMVLARCALLCGGPMLGLSLGFDREYYGTWTFPPLKFLQFNVVQSLSVFYGRNRPDYYFTEGLPLLLTTALPFAAVGIWQSLRPGVDRSSFRGYTERQTRFVLAVTVLTSVVALSLIAHKEVRFIYPLLPMLHLLAAKPFGTYFKPFPLPTSKIRLALLMFGLTINIYIAAYVSLVHQRGVIDVMHFLRHTHESSNSHINHTDQMRPMSVGFLMPCHSTPWRSHLVYPSIEARALTCEPPIDIPLSERESYLDEADMFYMHPASWIEDNMEDRKTVSLDAEKKGQAQEAAAGENTRDGSPLWVWPEYLVFFEHLEPIMNSVLEWSEYKECWRGFNTHWHDDGRRQGDVVVWRR